jgi:hypothetical protein
LGSDMDADAANPGALFRERLDDMVHVHVAERPFVR